MEQILHKMELGFNKIEDSQSVSPESTRNYTKQQKTETDQQKEKPKPQPLIRKPMAVSGNQPEGEATLCGLWPSVLSGLQPSLEIPTHSSYSSWPRLNSRALVSVELPSSSPVWTNQFSLVNSRGFALMSLRLWVARSFPPGLLPSPTPCSQSSVLLADRPPPRVSLCWSLCKHRCGEPHLCHGVRTSSQQ